MRETALGLEGRERIDGLGRDWGHDELLPVHLDQVAPLDDLPHGSALGWPELAREPDQGVLRQRRNELRPGRGLGDEHGCFRPHGSVPATMNQTVQLVVHPADLSERHGEIIRQILQTFLEFVEMAGLANGS